MPKLVVSTIFCCLKLKLVEDILRPFWEQFWIIFEMFAKQTLRISSKLFEKWPQNVRNKFSILGNKKSSWYQLAGVISAAMQQLSLLNFWASATSTASDWGRASLSASIVAYAPGWVSWIAWATQAPPQGSRLRPRAPALSSTKICSRLSADADW